MASFHNAIVALAATGGSTNAIVHLLAIAGRLGVDLRLDDFDRIGSSVPLLLNLQPAGRYLMDDLHRAGGLPRSAARGGGPARPRGGDRHRQAARRLPAGRADLGRRRDPATRRAAAGQRRDRRAARQPCSGRRGDQTRSGVQGAARAPRPRRRVRQHRGAARPARRPGPRHRRELRARAARVRAEGLPGDARGGEHADPAQAAGAGCPRPDPDQRRPDERHRLRHRRAARRARVRSGRPAVAGARTAT